MLLAKGMQAVIVYLSSTSTLRSGADLTVVWTYFVLPLMGQGVSALVGFGKKRATSVCMCTAELFDNV